MENIRRNIAVSLSIAAGISLCLAVLTLRAGRSPAGREGDGRPRGAAVPPERLAVSGRVVGSGKPFPGATVTLLGVGGASRAASGEDGRFSFQVPHAMAAGEALTVRASAPGWIDSRPRDLSPGGEDVELVLARGGTVAGEVLLPSGGDPGGPLAFEAEYEAPAGAGEGRRRVQLPADTATGGRFVLHRVPPGRFTLLARGPRFASAGSEVLTLEDGARLEEVVLHVPDAPSLVLAVPATGTIRLLIRGEGPGGLERRFDMIGPGEVHLPALPPGRYRIAGSAEGSKPLEREIEWPSGVGSLELDFEPASRRRESP